MPKMGETGHFWAQNHYFNVSLNLLEFTQVILGDRYYCSKWVKETGIFKENYYG